MRTEWVLIITPELIHVAPDDGSYKYVLEHIDNSKGVALIPFDSPIEDIPKASKAALNKFLENFNED